MTLLSCLVLGKTLLTNCLERKSFHIPSKIRLSSPQSDSIRAVFSKLPGLICIPGLFSLTRFVENGTWSQQESLCSTWSAYYCRGFEVKKRLKSGGKIPGVIFEEGQWLPVGPSERIFKMELGVVTRLLAPLHIFYWQATTPDVKEPLFQRLESEFEVNFNEPHVREIVDARMGMHFRQFKHRCHLHYKKFSTTEEARKHPPINVEIVDWIPLCEHFESEKFKSRSKVNKENRAKLEITHTSGSKSFSQRMYEKVNSEIPEVPSQVNLYYETHRKKDGTWVHPRAEENYNKMQALLSSPTEDGAPQKTDDQIREEVLGNKKYYTVGLGYGVKPSKSTTSREEARIQTQRVEEAERRAQQFYDKVQELQESQSKLQELVHTLVARLNGTNTSVDGTDTSSSLDGNCNV